jgi:hypothetical protein
MDIAYPTHSKRYEYKHCYQYYNMINVNINTVKRLIMKCIYEEDTDDKIKLFIKINKLLPRDLKIESPTMITKDFIDKRLYSLQASLG